MKTFALSLLAVVASANYGGYFRPQAPSGHHGSYSPYRRTSSHQYSPRPTHHGHSHHYPAPPAPTPKPFYPPYHPPHPAPEEEEDDAEEEEEAPAPYNPWEVPEADDDDDAEDTTGWYSPTMQYSPPKIPFKPNTYHPVFGICEFAPDDAGKTGSIQFAQLPGKATLYQATISMGGVDATYQVQLKENGKVATGAGVDCMATGDEFNPLEEINKYGNRNPFQDPSRGRIEDLVADANGDISVTPTFVLQNMTGKDGILGRAVTVQNTGAGMETDLECCVIALDENPVKFQAPPSFPSQGRHGHGHYGH